MTKFLSKQVNHKDEAMPPMTTFIEKGLCLQFLVIDTDSSHLSEPGDVSDDDDDVEIGGVTQDYKCPLTLTPLQDPLTSYAPLSPFVVISILITLQILGKRVNTPSPVLQSASTYLVA